MKEVLEGFQSLTEQPDASWLSRDGLGGEKFQLWFVGPRKLHHWLYEEVVGDFYLITKDDCADECLAPLRISKTLCTEVPFTISCAESEHQFTNWQHDLISLTPLPSLLQARKLLSTFAERGLRLPYPVFVPYGDHHAPVAAGGHDHAGSRRETFVSAKGGCGYLGIQTLRPYESSTQGIHVVETFSVDLPNVIPAPEIDLSLLMPGEEDAWMTARFELLSTRADLSSLRWCRGPFCCLELAWDQPVAPGKL